jgi:hypothetical protein
MSSLQQTLWNTLQTEHAQRQAAVREETGARRSPTADRASLALSDCASLTLAEYARRDAAAALATVTEQLANSVNDGAYTG